MTYRDWELVRLGDVVDLLTGYPFGSQEYIESIDGIKLLRGDNVVQGRLRWDNAKRWNSNNITSLRRYFLESDDVVLAMDRPWIEAGLKFARISQDDLPCLLVQRVSRLRGLESLDTKFLYYVVRSQGFTNHILSVQTGTAVPHISAEQIKEYEFQLPPLEEQRGIANILGSLDDKIALNRQMNATLEATTRTIFKSWFVDFDPVYAKANGEQPIGMSAEIAALFPDSFEESVLGLIPAGWRVSTIGQEVSVVGGSTPSTKEPLFWDGGTIAWATPKDLSDLASPVLLSTSYSITNEGLAQISSRLLPRGTVLLSSRAPVGYLALAAMPVAINQGFIAMVCEQQLPNYYVLLWAATNMEAIKGRANGTTFMEVSKSSFKPLSILVPPDELLHHFILEVGPLFTTVENNLRQSRTLAELRDVLLPKLISGEIRI